MPQNQAYRTEEELLEGLRSEAPGALEAFVDRYADLVHGVAVKITGDEDEARGLLRDAIVRTLSSLGTLKSAKAMERHVLRDVCSMLQEPERDGRTDEVALEDLLPAMKNGRGASVVDWSVDPGEEERRSEEKRALRELVAGMPRIYSLVLVLHDMEEFSPHNVADILQIPGQTVKERLHRARLLLRSGLTERLAASGSGGKGAP